ncbi:hypothetical protein QR680_006813 [Steinernema hermaphroditum]|uniref:RING-type domain-containing protein n=1 Tax=Steinernema hermaphroditum TaxID=289476 RepID=A0AA39LXP4_9BILA|nr:hypothetical protein QR680_006813 [Steinernema hermaphroditum]
MFEIEIAAIFTLVMADLNENTRVDYFCHQCSLQFHTYAPTLVCAHCRQGFIERIPRPDDFPAAHMPPALSLIVSRLAHTPNPALNVQGQESQQAHEEQNTLQQPGQEQQQARILDNFAMLDSDEEEMLMGDDDYSTELEEFLRDVDAVREQQQQNEEAAVHGAAGGARPHVHRVGRGIIVHFVGDEVAFNPALNVMEITVHPNLLAQVLDRIADTDIERLPMTKVTAEQTDKLCTTCRDNLHEGEEVGRLDCGHLFHRPCIVPWLQRHSTCPVCRDRIDPSKWTLQGVPDDVIQLE